MRVTGSSDRMATNPMQLIGKQIRKGTIYGGRQKRTVKSESGKSRYELLNPARARKSARQRQGRRISKDAYKNWINPPDPNAGINLKNGILGMAVRAGFEDGDIIYEKLTKMDPDRLYQLYANNELIFDVAFNYGGADSEADMDTRKGMRVIPGKKKDLEFLVEQYEKAFGPIL